MISISFPSVSKTEHSTTFSVEFTAGDTSQTLLYSIKQGGEEPLFAHRSDAFVVALLLHAMRTQQDIQFSAPLSERLFYQLEFHLIDFLFQIFSNKGFYRTKLFGPTTSVRLPSKGFVGTGISCGVDSLTSFLRQSDQRLNSLKLTHLCLFDTGSHGRSADEQHSSMKSKRNALASTFATDQGYPLILCESNVHDVLQDPYGFAHLFYNISVVLALQNLFSTYYYASGATVYDFLFSTEDPAYYQSYLMQLLSTETTTFYMSESTMSRFDKTKFLSSSPVAKKYLNVCNASSDNCGKCNKCVRTLLTLDALGCLNDFQNVFDLVDYRKNRSSFLKYHFMMYLEKDLVHREIQARSQFGFFTTAFCLACLHFHLRRVKRLSFSFLCLVKGK